jgi:quercetin dioxygenase-like cupin family protein
MAPFHDMATTEPLRIWEGVLARTIDGAQLSLPVVELDAGSIVREHSHENEQLGFVVSGSVTFRIGEETRSSGRVRPGRSRRTRRTRSTPARKVR